MLTELVYQTAENMAEKKFQKTTFIVDGSSFLYRAYYGLKPLHTSSGQTVQAVYGFCRMIKKLIDDFDVVHIAVVWDSKGKTHRHEIFADYKATRQEAPSDIFTQKDLIVEIVDAIGIKQIAQVGQEADDLMFSLATDFAKHGQDVLIVSSDKDMRQMLSDRISIYDPFLDKMITKESCLLRYGFEVEKLPFYFALLGDSSDNIPGVKGVGEKTATELVKSFKSLQDLYDNLDSVAKERTKQLLINSSKNAFLSQELFLLRYVDLSVQVADLTFHHDQWAHALPFFQKLEFKSLVKDIQVKYTQLATGSSQQALSQEIPLHQKYQFSAITQESELIDVCNKLRQVKSFAVDTETDGLDPMQATLVGISIAYEHGKAFYIPVAHVGAQQLELSFVIKHLGPIFADENIELCMHNAKYDILILKQAGFMLSNKIFDTLIAASLVMKEWEKKSLKDLSLSALGERMLTYSEVVSQYVAPSFAYVPVDGATNYAAADAHQTLQLVSIFKKEIEQQEMHDLLYQIELPVNDVLIAMQQEGIYCDRQILLELGKQVEQDLSAIEKQIYQQAGAQINLNSPKQIRTLLFETLKLTPQKKSGKTQELSTDAQVLHVLAKQHEIPQLLLAYRELYKLNSTYIQALPECINPKTGKIHTSWNQTTVATGRISSTNPNLQNIPRDGLEFGKVYDVDVRSAFKADQGWSFISADYSQIELRVLAHLSGDKSLSQAFLTDQDIHIQTASQIFGVDVSAVNSAQRNVGKRLNFSILYGLTAYGLARDLDIEYSEAKRYIDLYFTQYPGVKAWMEQVVSDVQATGYTKTWYGRRRYLPGIWEKNKNLFEMARRVAINTPAQGTAAEITKLGMIALHRELAKSGLHGKILLQIHDELLVACPKNEVDVTVELVKKSLIHAVNWDTKLDVSIRIGDSWKDVTK